MPTPTDFMKQAIELSAHEMRTTGAAPFAALIVRDGVVIGQGVNRVRTHHDATSHGEIEAIRDAGRRQGNWDLSGCEIYTTCEPCEMCVAAMFWANLKTMYYANSLKDCEEIGFDLKPLRDLVRSDLPARKMVCERVLPAEGRAVLDEWTTMPTFWARS